MTSALKLKPDKELAKLVGRHIICTEKARRRKKEQSLVRNITLSLPFMEWLHGSNVVHNPRGWGWVGRLVQGCGRILTTTPIYSLDGQSSVRLKSLFCFRSDNETLNGRYIRANTVTSRNQICCQILNFLIIFVYFQT